MATDTAWCDTRPYPYRWIRIPLSWFRCKGIGRKTITIIERMRWVNECIELKVQSTERALSIDGSFDVFASIRFPFPHKCTARSQWKMYAYRNIIIIIIASKSGIRRASGWIDMVSSFQVEALSSLASGIPMRMWNDRRHANSLCAEFQYFKTFFSLKPNRNIVRRHAADYATCNQLALAKKREERKIRIVFR